MALKRTIPHNRRRRQHPASAGRTGHRSRQRRSRPTHPGQGDLIIIDGNIIGIVTDRCSGKFWIGARLLAGLAIGWQEAGGGTVSDLPFRQDSDVLQRVIRERWL